MHFIFFDPETSRLRAGWRILSTSAGIILLVLAPVVLLKSQLWQTITFAVVVVLVMWVASKTWDHRKFSDFGFLLSRKWIKEFSLGNAIAIVSMSSVTGLLLISGNADLTVKHALTNINWHGLFSILILMTAVSVWEEGYFRAYLITNIKEGLGYKKIEPLGPLILSVMISSVFFGVAHAGNPSSTWLSAVNITAAGIVLAYPYIKTGRLAFSVGMHLSWNYFQGAVYGFPVSGLGSEEALFLTEVTGPEIITGGVFGPEGGTAGSVGIILMAILYYLYEKMMSP